MRSMCAGLSHAPTWQNATHGADMALLEAYFLRLGFAHSEGVLLQTYGFKRPLTAISCGLSNL